VTQRKPRATLDTNVWAAGISLEYSICAKIIDACEFGIFDAVITREIVSEVVGVLRNYFGKSDDEAYYWYWQIYTLAEVIEPISDIRECRDPDDDKFLVCAVDGECDYLVSNDRDLIDMKAIRGIPIIRPGQFYNIIRR